MLKVATVCSGIGSPEVAIRNLGIKHEIVFGCEIDKYARQTYLANFNPNMMLEDMTKEDWEDEKYYSDIIIAGIPCQAFSLAGKRLGELDARGLLFYDFYRYVKNQQPKYFIIENVKGLLSMDKGNVFNNWKALLGQSENGNMFLHTHEDSLMYNLHWKVLNTKNFGLPQNRERVFLIGIRKDLPNDFVFPKEIPLELRLKDLLEENVDKKYYLSDKLINTFLNRPQSKNYPFKPIKDTENEIACCLNARYYKMGATDNYIQLDVNGKGQNSQSDRVYFEDKIMGYIPASRTDSKVNIMQSDYKIRKLTPLECFRLQGFPDDYVKPVSNSQLYKQTGNSISVPVVENILKILLKKYIN